MCEEINFHLIQATVIFSLCYTQPTLIMLNNLRNIENKYIMHSLLKLEQLKKTEVKIRPEIGKSRSFDKNFFRKLKNF